VNGVVLGLPDRLEGLDMKKIYQKPQMIRRESLSKITAANGIGSKVV
jgi:hypothetical protein